jgi:MFS family permease
MMIACMGIGRFAYTPLLPQMQTQLGWNLAQAGDVASANFLGYFLGALLAAPLSQGRFRGYSFMLGLLGSAFTTLWGAVLAGATWPALHLLGSPAFNVRDTLSTEHLLWAWMALRFFSGAASAFCVVVGTPIIMARLAALGLARTHLLNTSHFAAVGMGIVLSVAVLNLMPAPITSALPLIARQWALLGIVSCLLMSLPLYFLAGPAKKEDRARAERSSAKFSAENFRAPLALKKLILAYGLMGFGYIVTATFIVAMTRQWKSPELEAWTWVAVGLAGTPSVFLWQKFSQRHGLMKALQCAYLVLIAGVLCAGLANNISLIVLGAVFLGGTFMAITSLGLQVAAQLSGSHSGLAMGWMTAAFGLGQLLGPSVAARLAQSSGSFALPSLLAAALLLLSVWLSRSE